MTVGVAAKVGVGSVVVAFLVHTVPVAKSTDDSMAIRINRII